MSTGDFQPDFSTLPSADGSMDVERAGGQSNPRDSNDSQDGEGAEDRRQRPMLGRLSGWRLILFVPVLLINVGAIVAMNFLPFILSGRNFELALCVLAATNCTFILLMQSMNCSAALKAMMALSHLLACLFAVLNFNSLSKIQPSPENIGLILSLVMQTVLMTMFGFAIAMWQNQKWQTRFSLSGLMVVLFGATILFPFILLLARSPLTFYFSSVPVLAWSIAAKFALVNCAIGVLVTSMFEWPSLNSRLVSIGRFLLLWNVIVVAVSRLFFAPTLMLTMTTVVLIWVAVSMLPFCKMKAKLV